MMKNDIRLICMIPEEAKALPTMLITLGNRTGYLTPFRGYGLQISATIDGITDIASSYTIDFETICEEIANIDEEEKRSSALIDLTGIVYTTLKDMLVSYNDNIQQVELELLRKRELIEEFVRRSYAYFL